ncbi:RNA polymerase sigma factor [Daejeonella lutea]|uniref:RNA polymerase sigma-70 factor, ECF subfamily n=1 Tax=Daejeonella lutea TaxID=572036 RepID=A0A1T5ESM3_9SPHI|nr:RNA polymerase sigma-70 factor [Daejeonella lutea]SKB86937.1 RNA polymerase sigma-70 factor, ECF subfamily [Daejeonella lutea]
MISTYSKLDDQMLLELLQAGDENALAAIYDRYWSKLYLQAYKVLRDRYQCEDIVQEIIVQLWTKRAANNIASLKAYLYACVRYQIFKSVRSAMRVESLETDDSETISDADNLILEKDIQKLLEAGVAELPAKCREIFTLSRKDHLSTKEIAYRLGLSPKTVENQLTIALRRLRSAMHEVMVWLLLLNFLGS